MSTLPSLKAILFITTSSHGLLTSLVVVRKRIEGTKDEGLSYKRWRREWYNERKIKNFPLGSPSLPIRSSFLLPPQIIGYWPLWVWWKKISKNYRVKVSPTRGEGEGHAHFVPHVEEEERRWRLLPWIYLDIILTLERGVRSPWGKENTKKKKKRRMARREPSLLR